MQWKGKTVLVTGGTGFIGSFLVEALLARGARVRVPMRAKNYRSLSARRSEVEWIPGDLRDPTYSAALVAGIDHIFHLASYRRNVAFHHERAGDVANENVRMTLALLEGLKDLRVLPSVTFFSTANVPPNCDALALAQRERVDGYVLGKALCEILWFVTQQQRRFPLLILRPVGVYGPRDTFAEDGNVIPAFFVKAQKSKDQMSVWGTGDEERAFLYVGDLVASLFTLLDAGAEGIQYVTGPDVVTIRQLAETVRMLVRPGLPIVYDTAKTVGERTIPLLPLHDCLRRFPWTPFKEGLRKTYAWWKHAE